MTTKISCFSILVCLLLSISLQLYPDSANIDVLIKDVPGLETFTNASAINVYTRVELNINPDFSFEKHVFHIKKILTYKGKKQYSDVKLAYNADFEKIKLGNCFAIDPEGHRITVPENQISDLTMQGSIMNPLINFRETIINFPRIEPGYFIVVEYTLYNNRKKPVNGIEHFRDSNPNMYKMFCIKCPARFRLNTHFNPKQLAFTRKELGSTSLFSWEARNTKIIKNENNTPIHLISGIPLAYSFYRDWQELARAKLSKIVNVRIDNPIKKLALQLTANAKTDPEKVLAVYEYLSTNFNYQMVIMSQLDFQPRPLTDIIKDKKGSMRDFSALFYALLKSAGIKQVYPALTLYGYQRFTEIQKKLAIDNFMERICVYWNNRLFHPGRSDIPFGFCLDEANVIIGNEKYEMIGFSSPNRFLEDITYHYEVTETSALVSARFILVDLRNQQFRGIFKDQPQVRRQIMFNRMLDEKSARLVEGPNFKNFDKIDEDLVMEFKLKYPDFLVQQDPYFYFKMFPPVQYVDVSLSERENDYQLFTRRFSREAFTINLDKKLKFVNPIESQRFEFPIGDRVAYFYLDSREHEGRIQLFREIYIPEGIINRENYPEFRAFILKIMNPVNNMIFLEKID